MLASELTKDEFYSVAKSLVPDITPEEYDFMWGEYTVARQEYLKKKEMS